MVLQPQGYAASFLSSIPNFLKFLDGMWSGAISEATEKLYPENKVSRDEIKSHLGKGFPWHSPDEPWLDELTSEKWWNRIFLIFEESLLSVGFSEDESYNIAREAKRIYLAKDSFKLFDDVAETLGELSDIKYRHAILSNHVPELKDVVNKLKIEKHFEYIFSSANIGYSKPHPEIYRYALKTLKIEPRDCWMIGDNEIADVVGPSSLGIKSILVRNTPEKKETVHYSNDLTGVLNILRENK